MYEAFFYQYTAKKVVPAHQERHTSCFYTLCTVCASCRVSAWGLFLWLKWIFVLVSSTEIKVCFFKEDLAVTAATHVVRQNNSKNISGEKESRETTTNAPGGFLLSSQVTWKPLTKLFRRVISTFFSEQLKCTDLFERHKSIWTVK